MRKNITVRLTPREADQLRRLVWSFDLTPGDEGYQLDALSAPTLHKAAGKITAAVEEFEQGEGWRL